MIAKLLYALTEEKRDRGVRRRVKVQVGSNENSRGFDHENNLLECFSSMIVRLGRHPHKACNHFEKDSGKQDTSWYNIPCEEWSIICQFCMMYILTCSIVMKSESM